MAKYNIVPIDEVMCIRANAKYKPRFVQIWIGDILYPATEYRFTYYFGLIRLYISYERDCKMEYINCLADDGFDNTISQIYDGIIYQCDVAGGKYLGKEVSITHRHTMDDNTRSIQFIERPSLVYLHECKAIYNDMASRGFTGERQSDRTSIFKQYENDHEMQSKIKYAWSMGNMDYNPYLEIYESV